MQACLDEYSYPQKSIAPYASQIWGSLKYEVRNGEIEDTIWGTLEVLKSLTQRLTGDNLRDHTLSVTRDCVPDLATTMYAASAGRLMISILSSKPGAFVLMAAPVITHIKENLRHPKAPVHSQDLHKVLHVILETRLLLTDSNMTAEEREDFAAIDGFFKSLYSEVYKSAVGLGSKENASYDDLKVATQAVQGAGALVCQRPAKSSDPSNSGASATSERLLPEETCSEICEALFAIVKRSGPGYPRSSTGDELINETVKALQRSIRLFPSGFNGLVDESMKIIRAARQNAGTAEVVDTVTTLGGLIAFVGSSELPSAPRDGFDHFVYSASVFLLELFDTLQSHSDPRIWCALVATIQSIIRHFNDACLASNPDKSIPIEGEPLEAICSAYTVLNQLGEGKPDESSLEYHSRVSQTASVAEIRNEFLLVTLFIVRQLYRRATKVIDTHPQTGKQALSLSDDFANVDQVTGHQYLHLISTLAGFVIHEFSEGQQTSLKAENFAITLFRNDSITIPQKQSDEQQVLENGSSWTWLASEALNVLSLGVLQALQPSAVARLVCLYMPHHM